VILIYAQAAHSFLIRCAEIRRVIHSLLPA
jgi:hypothetical protein